MWEGPRRVSIQRCCLWFLSFVTFSIFFFLLRRRGLLLSLVSVNRFSHVLSQGVCAYHLCLWFAHWGSRSTSGFLQSCFVRMSVVKYGIQIKCHMFFFSIEGCTGQDLADLGDRLRDWFQLLHGNAKMNSSGRQGSETASG